MQRINLSDIVWSRDEYCLSDIPELYRIFSFPIAAIVTTPCCAIADDDGSDEDEEAHDWPNYQMFCICGSSSKKITINSQVGEFQLPASFPLKLCVKSAGEDEDYQVPMTIRNAIAAHRVPFTAKFDPSIKVSL